VTGEPALLSRGSKKLEVLLIGDGPIPHRYMNYSGDHVFKSLMKSGHKVTLVAQAPENRSDYLRNSNQLEVHYIAAPSRYRLGMRPAFYWRLFSVVASVMKKHRFDVVRPISLLPSLAALLARDGSRTPILANISDFYSDLYGQFELPAARLVSPSIELVEKFVATHLDFLIVDTEVQRQAWLKYGIDSGRCLPIPHGIPFNGPGPEGVQASLAGIRKRHGIGERSKVGFYIGDISAMDGVDILIRACAILNLQGIDFEVIIVGAGMGSYLKGLGKLAAAGGVSDKVHFLSRIPHSEVSRYVAAADVCVAPFRITRTSNTSVPNKVLEYLASEVPIVVSPGMGIREVLEDYVIYFDGATPAKLAVGLLKALDSKPLNRHESYLKIVRKLNWEKLMAVQTRLTEYLGTRGSQMIH
jgi:glycosyltransferase involved in cell wall biosynthesis